MNKPEFSEFMVSVRQPSAHHTHYVFAEVIVTGDYSKGSQRVIGRFGIAPTSDTPIEYPIDIDQQGYWNKTQTRQMVAMVKTRLLQEIKNLGYSKTDFNEPLEIKVHSGSILSEYSY